MALATRTAPHASRASATASEAGRKASKLTYCTASGWSSAATTAGSVRSRVASRPDEARPAARRGASPAWLSRRVATDTLEAGGLPPSCAGAAGCDGLASAETSQGQSHAGCQGSPLAATHPPASGLQSRGAAAPAAHQSPAANTGRLPWQSRRLAQPTAAPPGRRACLPPPAPPPAPPAGAPCTHADKWGPCGKEGRGRAVDITLLPGTSRPAPCLPAGPLTHSLISSTPARRQQAPSAGSSSFSPSSSER